VPKQNELGVTPQSEDFSAWYNEIVLKAELADRGPAKGTMIIRPDGYQMWELLQAELDRHFRDSGHRNAYFPLFIPMSFMEKEAEHVEGFAPELAVVTHGGGKELEEPLVVRPTSETVIGEAYSRWISSYRDLPVLINQWANVVRWEMRPRIFLRTTEFLWQEGHTAHADQKEAEEETSRMFEIYQRVARDFCAIPVVAGEKTPSERFAGAVNTYSIEGMMRDGKALQSATSHYLGTNFAKVFEINYQSKTGSLELCHTTSWGMSTRMLGGVIMAHGDDKGLILPPRIAPTQVVIITIGRDNDIEKVNKAAKELAERLKNDGVRVQVDDRDSSPGFKFNDADLRGIPLKIEIGPRDLAEGNVVVSNRLDSEKQSLSTDAFVSGVRKMLDDYQDTLLARAEQFRNERSAQVDNWDDFVKQVEIGFAYVLHCGDSTCEEKIKAETTATPRVIPLDAPKEKGNCFLCGSKSAYGRRVLFARAY
jgi:prolyl-tRNA synthetase